MKQAPTSNNKPERNASYDWSVELPKTVNRTFWHQTILALEDLARLRRFGPRRFGIRSP